MKIVKKLKKMKMHISLSSVCKHTNKIQRYKAQHFQLVVKGGGGMVVGEILGGIKGNFGYNEISESPIFCPQLIVNQPLNDKLYDRYNYKSWYRKLN